MSSGTEWYSVGTGGIAGQSLREVKKQKVSKRREETGK